MIGSQNARKQAELERGLSNVDQGICVDVDLENTLCTVNIGGAEQVMMWAFYPPWEGDTVVVGYLGKKPIAFAQWGSPMGTVGSSDSELIVATGDDGREYIYPYTVGYSPAPGDRVVLLHSHRHIPGEYTDEPAGSEYRVPDAPPGQSGQATFYPIDSAGWRFGTQYQGSGVDASASKGGAYFYGYQIANTIPDSATIDSMVLHLTTNFDYFPGENTPVLYHGEPGPHGAAQPAFGGAGIACTGPGAVSLMDYANLLKTGAALGVGFDPATAQRQFGNYTISGAITATWH